MIRALDRRLGHVDFGAAPSRVPLLEGAVRLRNAIVPGDDKGSRHASPVRVRQRAFKDVDPLRRVLLVAGAFASYGGGRVTPDIRRSRQGAGHQRGSIRG